MGAISDSIADGLTKIRNASRAKHATVDLRASRMLGEMLNVLKQEGFIRSYKPMGETPKDRGFRVYLKYVKNRPLINELIRVSKPGRRTYEKAATLPRVLGGLGTALISTSKGLMTEQDAYRQHIGGEVVCYVW